MGLVLHLVETRAGSRAHDVDVLEPGRPGDLRGIASLGLTLPEAKQLLACVQQAAAARQASAGPRIADRPRSWISCPRPCRRSWPAVPPPACWPICCRLRPGRATNPCAVTRSSAASDYARLPRSRRRRRHQRPCCRDQRCERSDPSPFCVQATRTEFGRPNSGMRLRAWTATPTSVARRGSVRERSPSPITCLNLPMVASARARMV